MILFDSKTVERIRCGKNVNEAETTSAKARLIDNIESYLKDKLLEPNVKRIYGK